MSEKCEGNNNFNDKPPDPPDTQSNLSTIESFPDSTTSSTNYNPYQYCPYLYPYDHYGFDVYCEGESPTKKPRVNGEYTFYCKGQYPRYGCYDDTISTNSESFNALRDVQWSTSNDQKVPASRGTNENVVPPTGSISATSSNDRKGSATSTTTTNNDILVPTATNSTAKLPQHICRTCKLCSCLRPTKYQTVQISTTTDNSPPVPSIITVRSVDYSKVLVDKASKLYTYGKHKYNPGWNCFTVTLIYKKFSVVFQKVGHIAFSDVTTYYSDYGVKVNKRDTVPGCYVWVRQGLHFRRYCMKPTYFKPLIGEKFGRKKYWFENITSPSELHYSGIDISTRTITHTIQDSIYEKERFGYYRYKPKIIPYYAHIFLPNEHFRVPKGSVFGQPAPRDTRPFSESWMNSEQEYYTEEEKQEWQRWVFQHLLLFSGSV